MARKENYSLDLLKGIGCMAVVLIHIHFPSMFGDIMVTLSQFAVPVFFMISGFFAYSAAGTDKDATLKRRMLRIAKISIYSTLFYGIVRMLMALLKGTIGEGGSVLFLGKTIIKFLLLNDSDFLGCAHLWFLWALIYVYAILRLVNRYNFWKQAYIAMGMLFWATIIVHSSHTPNWHLKGNWLLTGIPYVFMGHFIAEYKEKFCMLSNRKLLAIAVIGAFISLYRVFAESYDFSEIGIIFYAIALFVWAIKNPNLHISSWLERLGSKYSLYVYVSHVFFIMVVQRIIKMFALTNPVIPWLAPIIVIGLSIIFSILFIKVKSVWQARVKIYTNQ